MLSIVDFGNISVGENDIIRSCVVRAFPVSETERGYSPRKVTSVGIAERYDIVFLENLKSQTE